MHMEKSDKQELFGFLLAILVIVFIFLLSGGSITGAVTGISQISLRASLMMLRPALFFVGTVILGVVVLNHFRKT